MPNYVLSRTSPPAHIYERKVNLGYGVKVDTSDAPGPKERKEDVKEVLDVVDKPVRPAAFADGTVFESGGRNITDASYEAQEAEEVEDSSHGGSHP